LTAEAELRHLVGHLFAIMEKERGEVARILHDELGQALTVAKMELHSARRRIALDRAGVEPQLASIASVIDESMRTVRRLSADLRPGVLTDLGLEAAVEWQVERLADATGVRCQLTANVNEQIIGSAQATAAFRILQEVLAYVSAQAHVIQAIAVHVTTDEHQLAMEITVQADDNDGGMGEMPALLALSVRERAQLMGGRVTVQRVAGEDVQVNLTLPHAAIEGARHDQGLDCR
jgi:signal transduction histidine kinase